VKKDRIECPECGAEIDVHRNPFPTADCLISMTTDDGREGLVLIERRNEPHGWALPGGFVDYGESVPDAVRREMHEETGLELDDLTLFGVYSDPARDPRFHTIATVFAARGRGELQAGDDAAEAVVFPLDELPPVEEIVFDHGLIITDWLGARKNAGTGGDA